MPTLKVYEKQMMPSSEVGAVAKDYRGIEQNQQNLEKVLGTVDYIAKTWEEADYTSQLTTAQNNLTAQILEFDNELANLNISADETGDYSRVATEKRAELEARLQTILQNPSTISNSRAKRKYNELAEIAGIRSKIKLDTALRDSLINHQKLEVERSGILLRKTFINGNIDAKEVYRQQLSDNLKKGFISEEEYYSNLDEANVEWERDRAMLMAKTDPEEAKKIIDGIDIDDLSKSVMLKDVDQIKESADQEEKRIIKQQEEAIKDNMAMTEVGMLNTLAESGIDSFSIDEIINMVSQSKINKDFANALIRVQTMPEMVDPEYKVEDSGFSAYAESIVNSKDRDTRSKAWLETLKGTYGKKLNAEELSVLIKSAAQLTDERKRGFVANALNAIKTASDFLSPVERTKKSFLYLKAISEGMKPKEAMNTANLELANEKGVDLNGVTEEGQIMVDANGNRALVYPDGSYKLLGVGE